uniref:Uncharacterized protein n=1 Tax=Leptocylindrus danicus TaxID=163516 RepID=A0A7S2P111_9STRA|mmetsp:Transcript_20398/g.30424  ORF Transcript_20398/g.30424 Transcript_20398/m.30424 type:complete len:267 (+) Transcript_20398:46-846(+)|eukprot:CAMPEP_0116030872 /NCGR_PEP_ID=MMETSP0321-20121206/17135_1 /TAXON_ID=163516 /ORGANISM="Leptocylindrus danicus var. danicus, Strain B650" /LENGTH=266 /DNA_ID=CAMNT_0003505805 /DNA_START=42 /DNA_END=842 /DNA_ORIENTATION=+
MKIPLSSIAIIATSCILSNGDGVAAAFSNNVSTITKGGFTSSSTPRSMSTTETEIETESSLSPSLVTAPGEIDEAAAYAESTFPIAPNDLIVRAKEVLIAGIGNKDDGACLAPDFEFCAAVVGPLPKEEYLEVGTFKLEDSFDIQQNFFGFIVDPTQTNRVWFFSRQVAKQVAVFMGAAPDDREELVLPPQLMHMDFDDDGLVKEFGFYTVDRRQGNTGGVGGAFGYFYGVGRPFPIPEGRPFKKSFQFRLLEFIGNLGKMLKKKQ